MKLSVKGLCLSAMILWGGAVLFVGLANVVWPTYGVVFLQCLDSIYPGYTFNGELSSVLVVTGYALVDGAVGGLVFAVLYNLCAGCCKKPGGQSTEPGV